MNLSEKFLKSLDFEQLSAEEIDYIKSAVSFIDENVSKKMSESSEENYLEEYAKEVLRIVTSIKQRSTGNPTIDSMDVFLPYTDSFIASISENGGMYRKALKSYSAHENEKFSAILEDYHKSKKSRSNIFPEEPKKIFAHNKNAILNSIDIPEKDKAYILAAKQYLETSIESSMEDEAPKDGFVETYTQKMIDIVRNLKSKRTGIPEIDYTREDPQLSDYFISILSKYGGFYDYVTSIHSREVYQGLNVSPDMISELSKKLSLTNIFSALTEMVEEQKGSQQTDNNQKSNER